MNEYVASTVIRLDEAVASFAVKELHNTRLRHRESPQLLRRRPHARRLGWTFTVGESVSQRPQSLRRPPQEAERHCQVGTTHQLRACGKRFRHQRGRRSPLVATLVEPETAFPVPTKNAGQGRQERG